MFDNDKKDNDKRPDFNIKIEPAEPVAQKKNEFGDDIV
jgi:hypothetical protein